MRAWDFISMIGVSMKFEIKHRVSGAVLFSLETDSLKLCVEVAVKQGAYLQGADLRGADLQGADLQGADLRGAKNLNPYRHQPLLMLYAQKGKQRAYKLTTSDYYGPVNGGVKWTVGKTLTFPDFNSDENEDCAAGGNIATLDWCLRNYEKGRRILLVEFSPSRKNLCVPIYSDGKFRVKRCKVLRELKPEEYVEKS